MKPWLARNLVTPALLQLRREPVAAGLADLARSAQADPAVDEARRIERFRVVARAGAARFPFYARMLKDAGAAPDDVRSRDDLRGWPLMDKSHLRAAVQELRGGGGRLPRHTVRLSGGSSGEPCVVLADRRATGYALAARQLCQGWHGLRPGDRQIRFWGRPLPRRAYLEILKDRVLNRIRLDSEALGPDHLDATCRRIAGFGAEYLYGYASLLRLFGEGLDERQVARLRQGGLKVAISTSEVMPQHQRRALAGRLGVPVIDEYGCSEVDIIAFGCPRGRSHVVAGNILLETVRSGDEPEGYGRVTVTDLNNTLMPVVRYTLGDLVPLEAGTCDCGCRWPCLGPVLGRVQGQFIELDGGRRRIHSQFLVYIIEEMVDEGAGFARFQIVQEREDALALQIELQPGARPDLAAVEERLRRAAAGVLGAGITWRIEVVAGGGIGRTSGGKYRHFISRIAGDE